MHPSVYCRTGEYHEITLLHQDGGGTLVLFGDALGDPDGLQLGDPTGSVVHEEDPLLGPVGVGDRSLGEDGQGVLYPLDDDHEVGGLLLNLLGHRKQRELI